MCCVLWFGRCVESFARNRKSKPPKPGSLPAFPPRIFPTSLCDGVNGCATTHTSSNGLTCSPCAFPDSNRLYIVCWSSKARRGSSACRWGRMGTDRIGSKASKQPTSHVETWRASSSTQSNRTTGDHRTAGPQQMLMLQILLIPT